MEIGRWRNLLKCNAKQPAVGAAGGDHAVTNDNANKDAVPFLGSDWFDPLYAYAEGRLPPLP